MVQAENDEFGAAKIFLHKYSTTLDTPIVMVNRNLVITYSAYNGGETDASLLSITDSYHPESFVLVDGVGNDGKMVKTFRELAAGETVSFNITVAPKITGLYESTRAKLQYNPSAVVMEDVATEYRHGYSTSLGKIKIVTEAEFNRIQSGTSMFGAVGGIAIIGVIILAVLYAISRPKTTETISKPTKKQHNS